DEETECRPRHRLRETSQVVDVAAVGRVDDGAGTQEEQRLEEGMVPDVQQAPSEAENHPISTPQRTADEGQAEADHDDADVLDAVVGQETLDIMLADGEGDAQYTTDRTQTQERSSPCQRRMGNQ